MNKLVYLFITLFLFINMSCQKEVEREGYVVVEGEKIWYKIIGDGEGIHLLILHGGPGSRSCSMIPGFSLLGNERTIIFYDQLGSGNSQRPNDTTLWNKERFVDEIDHLRKSLNLKELHILGHSCGSTFLIEYMITKKPEGVKSVIFSSPIISTADWIKDAKILLGSGRNKYLPCKPTGSVKAMVPKLTLKSKTVMKLLKSSPLVPTPYTAQCSWCLPPNTPSQSSSRVELTRNLP